MTGNPIYIVTDAEFDGPTPGVNSMLSFASVAVNAIGDKLGEFEAVLERLPNASTHPDTDAFWKRFPEAYAAATLNPEPAEKVMSRFVAWIRSLGGDPLFTAHPAGLDGPWIDYYLQRFTTERLLEGAWKPHRLFKGAPFCLMTFAAGRLGWSPLECDVGRYPAEWLGSVEHTHRAIDDARGYANLLVYLMSIRAID